MALKRPPGHVADFTQLHQEHLTTMPPGGAFHAMVHPCPYPPDKTYVRDWAKDPATAPPLIGETYRSQLTSMLGAAAVVQRLVVLFEPTDTRYNPTYAEFLAQTYAAIEADGLEEVRVTRYGSFMARLQAEPHWTPLTWLYRSGVESDDPKASFWATYPLEQNQTGHGWQTPSLVALQHYSGQQSLGADIYTNPLPDDLADYVRFCRDVFEDPHQSIPIAQSEI